MGVYRFATERQKGNSGSNVKKLAILSGILALAVPLAVAQTSVWATDPAHSEVDFTTRRLDGMLSDVHGRFGRVTGELDLNEADVTKSTVRMNIDLAGLDTNDEIRDEHLRSEAFFEVSVFPTATFVSTSVGRNGRGLTVTGNLTLRDFTRPVTLHVDAPRGPKIGPDKKLHTSYEATTTISRSAFAVGNSYLEPSISDTVKLEIKLDTVKKR